MKEIKSKAKKRLRYGYTTGSCATAAAKAATLYLINGEKISEVEIKIPANDSPWGDKLSIKVKSLQLDGKKAKAEVVKNAGDDPDITNGISIIAEVELIDEENIEIHAGSGIGIVSRPGLAVPVGQAAINPIPKQMIIDNLKNILPDAKGAKVTLYVPEGEKLAEKTFNPRLGILGGISIIGTTGIVRPLSRKAYILALLPQVKQAREMGHKTVILTPGGKGAKIAARMGAREEIVIQTGNYIGRILDECVKEGLNNIILMGHIGKIIKVAGGIFNTDSRIADARREILAAHLALEGAKKEIIQAVMQINTIEASLEIIKEENLQSSLYSIAEWASKRSKERCGEKTEVGTILYRLDGEIIALDKQARILGGSIFGEENSDSGNWAGRY